MKKLFSILSVLAFSLFTINTTLLADNDKKAEKKCCKKGKKECCKNEEKCNKKANSKNSCKGESKAETKSTDDTKVKEGTTENK